MRTKTKNSASLLALLSLIVPLSFYTFSHDSRLNNNQRPNQTNRESAKIEQSIGTNQLTEFSNKRGVNNSKPLEELLVKKNPDETSLLERIAESQYTNMASKKDIREAEIMYGRMKPFKNTLESIVYGNLILNVSGKEVKTRVMEGIDRETLYYLLVGLVGLESSWKEKAYNPYGAHGLGQITKIALEEYNRIIEEYHPKIDYNGKTIKLEKYTIKGMLDGNKNLTVMAVFLNHLYKTTNPNFNEKDKIDIFSKLGIDPHKLEEYERETILKLYSLMAKYSGNAWNRVYATKYAVGVMRRSEAFRNFLKKMYIYSKADEAMREIRMEREQKQRETYSNT